MLQLCHQRKLDKIKENLSVNLSIFLCHTLLMNHILIIPRENDQIANWMVFVKMQYLLYLHTKPATYKQS